ncbi:MAG: ABC transporter permease [Gemmataceae bacterium]
MQFLAFLKDSYREARNGWMLQIMLVLSGLLVLLVASVGYRPITMEDMLKEPLSWMRWGLSHNPQRYAELGKPELTVENFTSTNAAEPWRADYTFEYVVKVEKTADIRKTKEAGLPLGRERVKRFFRDMLAGQYESVEVTGGLPQLEPPEKKDGDKKKADDDEDDDFPAPTGKLEGPPPPPETRYTVTARGSKVDDPLAWPHQVTALFLFDIPSMHVPLRTGVYVIESWLVNKLGAWVALAVAVIVTAGFIPNMLAKGSLDLIVSKPIGRVRLLVYKYLGGLMFVGLLGTFTVVGVWVAVGLRSGLWAPNFLAVLPMLMFYFAVLYAVSTLAAVVTRSTIVSILVTVVVWAMILGLGIVRDGIIDREEEDAKPVPAGRPGPNPDRALYFVIPKASFSTFKAIHVVTPRTYQLDARLARIIAEGVMTPNQLKAAGFTGEPRASWAEMIGVSVGFIGVMLGLACWRFAGRDY